MKVYIVRELEPFSTRASSNIVGVFSAKWKAEQTLVRLLTSVGISEENMTDYIKEKYSIKGFRVNEFFKKEDK